MTASGAGLPLSIGAAVGLLVGGAIGTVAMIAHLADDPLCRAAAFAECTPRLLEGAMLTAVVGAVAGAVAARRGWRRHHRLADFRPASA